ncbi:MAG: hypothetical protein GF411_19450 [Candidatus Lokiarchaeota archaeon]|nr:hypothetical protein [Candidatus Lokiarchaeota archaeon]
MRGHRYRRMVFPMHFGECCHDECGHPFGASKATKIKRLEALKSCLEDYIKHIDDEIAGFEKVKEEA